MRRFVLLLVVIVVLGGAGWMLYAFGWPTGPRGGAFVELTPGMSSREMAAALEKQGVIASRYAFYVLRLTRGGVLKAGEYRFAEPRRVGQVYDEIAEGDVYAIALTLPEGSNIFDVARRVEAAKLGSYASFVAAERANVKLVRELDPEARSLEGYLFPDTYHFAPQSTAEQMLGAMVRRFRQEAAEQGLKGNTHRVVTLASLVERETPLDPERPMVASVFENRLERGMALETDPTVIYAALLEGRYKGTIYQSDLAAESPYNTYRHPGLPPGPICSPGAVSLRAALHPAQTNYIYFVAAGSNPQGQSRFAETLAEHQKNVAAYRHSIRGGSGR